MNKLKILLADDHPILREGLATLINRQPDMEVLMQAGDGEEALRLAQTGTAELAILDISMPKLNGTEVAERMKQQCPHVKVLTLTRHSNSGYLYRMFKAGAKGFVLKKTAAEDLINAIRVVAAGGTYVEPELAADLAEEAIRTTNLRTRNGIHPKLTARESEVLSLIAWGRSNKEIANKLKLSVKTVESYKAGAVEKLNLRSRSEILRYALSRGWLDDGHAPD